MSLRLRGWWIGGLAVLAGVGAPSESMTREVQVTSAEHGHILTNTGVWSPDGRWVVYDVRSDAAGERFDGTRIEAVDVVTREVRVLYTSGNGAACGVVTFHPRAWRVVFIHGPEHPAADWSYGPYHREGTMVDWDRPGVGVPLDARDLTPPLQAGALRGGSHVHVFSPAGDLVSYTYEDHLLAVADGRGGAERNQRNVGVSVPGHPVTVDRGHPRNRDGTAFSVLVTRTTDAPRPGSDEISRAYEEGWVGTDGYVRGDGTRQRRALAFLGQVAGTGGRTHAEVFVVDLPEDLTRERAGRPLAGTEKTRPWPPEGCVQRRLTFTGDRPHPGVQGPRHWLRSSPDGSRIAFLMRDGDGVTQLWTVSPLGGAPRQVTRNPTGISSAFTWTPDGRAIAHGMDGSVCLTDAGSGETRRLTERREGEGAPRPEACVVSPDGGRIAYVRRVPGPSGAWHNQVMVVEGFGD